MKVVGELASALDLVRLRATAVLDVTELEDIEDIADRVDERRGFPGDTFVVALSGGTGAGKSSLVNALAGAEVASVSAVRPHTDRPLALTPADPSADLTSFLDDMGIGDRHEQDRFTDLAIIDLPDQDSVAMEHRELVWQVLPEADAIVWVTDPDKYQDAVFLRDYVGGLAAYQDQALFVLNKADLLSEDEIEEVKADYIGQLEVAGIVQPRVFVVAASPPHRAAIGVEEFAAHLADQMEAKRVMASKTVADVSRAVSLIASRARLSHGGSVGYDERWALARSVVNSALESGDPAGAIAAMDDLVASLVAEVGPSFGRRLVKAVPAQMIEKEMTAAAAAIVARSPRPVPEKGRRGRKGGEPDEVADDVAAIDLDGLFGTPLRDLMWERAYLGATVAAVSVQAAQAQARLSR